MKRFATHSHRFTLIASLALLLASRALVADEPVDPEEEVSAALTEASGKTPAAEGDESADAEPFDATADKPAFDPGEVEAVSSTDATPAPGTDTPAGTPVTDAVPAVAGGESTASKQPAGPGDTSGKTGTPPAGEPEAGATARSAEDTGLAIDLLGDGALEQGRTIPLADAVSIADETTARTLTLLKADVLPGTYQRLSWSATEMFEDLPVSTPVLVVNGKAAGPTLCLTAAVHGDELNGIEMVRRVMHDLNPQKLAGAVVGVPIVNLQGFRRGSRYLPDRRDLNRYFPGNPRGSAASRIAHSFFTEVIEHCDALIDLHTGSFDRANLPQLRADLRNPDVVTLTHGFGATVILHSEPADGTLRHAATYAGIPTVTLEAGGPSELELKEVMHGVKGIETLLNTLGMVDKIRLWGDQQPVYYRSSWVRANRGGILLADVSLGSTVRRGDLLGTITDPMNNASTNLYSPYSGRVIGMARNQVVMPGFAAFHVGIQAVDASTADNDARNSRGQDKKEALAHESETNSDDYVDGMSE